MPNFDATINSSMDLLLPLVIDRQAYGTEFADRTVSQYPSYLHDEERAD